VELPFHFEERNFFVENEIGAREGENSDVLELAAEEGNIDVVRV
jgi:hypothetical protein